MSGRTDGTIPTPRQTLAGRVKESEKELAKEKRRNVVLRQYVRQLGGVGRVFGR
jgi:hypothetical protein